MLHRPGPRERSQLIARVRTAVLRAAIATFLSAAPALADPPRVQIVGSDSMAPFLERIANDLELGGAVRVEGRGSETGPVSLLRGEASIASMTRALTPIEAAGFEARYGRQPIAFPVAVDAVAILVNVENPLREIRLEQIPAIFLDAPGCGAETVVQRWGALGPELVESDLADRRIGVYVPPAVSGTLAFFREFALCGERLVGRARHQPGTDSVAIAVAESRFGVGIGTLADLSPKTQALALPARSGEGFVLPTPPNVRSGEYPFSRELMLVALPDENDRLSDDVRSFLTSALSKRGQALIEEAGFLALPPERLAAARAGL